MEQKTSVFSEAAKFGGRRHKIGRTILVAGPSCVGKTTLMKKLRRGLLPDLQNRLKMGDLACWHFRDAMHMSDYPETEIPNLVLHYDILRLMDQGFPDYASDPVLGRLASCGELLILTLRERPEVLCRRCLQRRRRTWSLLTRGCFRLFYQRYRRLGRKCRMYSAPSEVMALYENWFGFCSTLAATEHLVAHSFHPEKPLADFMVPLVV